MGLIRKKGWVLLGRLKPGSVPLNADDTEVTYHDIEHFLFSSGSTYMVGNQDIAGSPGLRNPLQWVHQALGASTVSFRPHKADRLYVRPGCPRGVWTPLTLHKTKCTTGSTANHCLESSKWIIDSDDIYCDVNFDNPELPVCSFPVPSAR